SGALPNFLRSPRKHLRLDPARAEQSPAGDLESMRAGVAPGEPPAHADRGDAERARSGERVDHQIISLAALSNQHLCERYGLLRRVPIVNAGYLENIRHAEAREPPLPLLEEQDTLVAGAIMVAHADLALVPDERLPELEAARLGDGLRQEH